MPSLCLLCALCLKAINQTTDTSWTISSSKAFLFIYLYLKKTKHVFLDLRSPRRAPADAVSLCRYVIGTLELLVAENYMIVYLNGATSRRKMPSVGWLRKCYQQVDRR